MSISSDLEGYVAECERKIAALEKRLERVEARLAATITIATREAINSVTDRFRAALEDE